MSLKSTESKKRKNNFGNKNRRVKEDSGRGARSFKLSVIFVILMFLSLALYAVDFVVDWMSKDNMIEYTLTERAIRDEIIAMKSASLSLTVF
jgi:hypothetical protein